jgi:hypothetical protein
VYGIYKYNIYFNITLEEANRIIMSWNRLIEDNDKIQDIAIVLSKTSKEILKLKTGVNNGYYLEHDSNYSIPVIKYVLLIVTSYRHLSPDDVKKILEKFDLTPKKYGQDKR